MWLFVLLWASLVFFCHISVRINALNVVVAILTRLHLLDLLAANFHVASSLNAESRVVL